MKETHGESPGSEAGPHPAEDTALMRRVQAGEEAALGALMERWEVPVKRLLARIVLNERDAADLAQDTFVRVWQQRAKFRDGAAVRPWIFAIAVNLGRNRLRWWRRRPEISLQQWTEHTELGDGRTETASRVAERAERVAAVQAAVAALPGELRAALVLFEYEGLAQAEIAAALGCTPKAVESRVARAREKLRVALKRWAGV